MLPDKLHLKLGMRHFAGSLRTLKTITGKVDFASNDYLGFSKLLKVPPSDQHGATGSRLISGHTLLHDQVEKQIALFHKVESALLFNSGYDANLGLIAAVTDRFDLIIYDELVHASIRDGISLSQAKSLKYRHNDLKHLEILLNKFHENEDREVYVITESVFSMDGDQPDLAGIVDLVHKFDNVHLILDEAHALGVIGKNGAGLAQELGVECCDFCAGSDVRQRTGSSRRSGFGQRGFEKLPHQFLPQFYLHHRPAPAFFTRDRGRLYCA